MTIAKLHLLGSFRTRTFREKLERAFQKAVEADKECLAVLEHYNRLNLQVVIEKVETQEGNKTV